MPWWDCIVCSVWCPIRPSHLDSYVEKKVPPSRTVCPVGLNKTNLAMKEIIIRVWHVTGLELATENQSKHARACARAHTHTVTSRVFCLVWENNSGMYFSLSDNQIYPLFHAVTFEEVPLKKNSQSSNCTTLNVFAAVWLRTHFFWDMKLCQLVMESWHFKGTQCPRLQPWPC